MPGCFYFLLFPRYDTPPFPDRDRGCFERGGPTGWTGLPPVPGAGFYAFVYPEFSYRSSFAKFRTNGIFGRAIGRKISFLYILECVVLSQTYYQIHRTFHKQIDSVTGVWLLYILNGRKVFPYLYSFIKAFAGTEESQFWIIRTQRYSKKSGT